MALIYGIAKKSKAKFLDSEVRLGFLSSGCVLGGYVQASTDMNLEWG